MFVSDFPALTSSAVFDMTRELDLAPLTDAGSVTVISGRDRGVVARDQLHLDDLDAADDTIIVTVPMGVRAITPSFVLGMFGPSVQRAGSEEQFFKKYQFRTKPHIL